MRINRLILEYEPNDYCELCEFLEQVVANSTFPSSADTKTKQRSMVIHALLQDAWNNHTGYSFNSDNAQFQEDYEREEHNRNLLQEAMKAVKAKTN